MHKMTLRSVRAQRLTTLRRVSRVRGDAAPSLGVTSTLASAATGKKTSSPGCCPSVAAQKSSYAAFRFC